MESLSSLRFASQVNACEIGRPKRSVKAGGEPVGEREPRPSVVTSGLTSGRQSLAPTVPRLVAPRGPQSTATAVVAAAAAGRKPASQPAVQPQGLKRPQTAR